MCTKPYDGQGKTLLSHKYKKYVEDKATYPRPKFI